VQPNGIREEIHDMADQLSVASPAAKDRQDSLERALFEIKRVIAGQDTMLERVLVCLLADGHLLIEGVPGLAKTLTIKTTAQVLGGTFNRIQFTPDLMPSDLVGTRIYRPHDGEFDVELGPVFCNFLLADEINRAPAKVQSALLEVMQERQVTIGKQSFAAPSPFLVMATQNPIESEGTYPLPEAQVDRFMLKVVVGYPGSEDELTVVERSLAGLEAVRQIIELEELSALRAAANAVYVDPALSRYAVQIAGATRDPESAGLPELKPYVAFGASPRGPISLMTAARALALIRGRDYVLPQDVRELAKDALHHRIVLSYEALAAEVGANSIVDSVLEVVSMPEIDLVERAA
jgi:MoxR-like ATPase